MRPTTDGLIRASSLASLTRGLVGLLVPRPFARLAGTRPDATRTRLLLGVREVVVGTGLLVAPRPPRWLAARLAGDLLDVGLHTIELFDRPVRSRRTVIAWAVVVAACAADAWLLAAASR